MAPLYSYAAVSLSNVIATTCQYEALKWVSFAVQTLGKCAKMFPVMIWGALMLGRRYTYREVGMAVTITSGCFVFFMTGNTSSRVAKAGSQSSLYGLALMAGYLGADGFTSTVQVRREGASPGVGARVAGQRRGCAAEELEGAWGGGAVLPLGRPGTTLTLPCVGNMLGWALGAC